MGVCRGMSNRSRWHSSNFCDYFSQFRCLEFCRQLLSLASPSEKSLANHIQALSELGASGAWWWVIQWLATTTFGTCSLPHQHPQFCRWLHFWGFLSSKPLSFHWLISASGLNNFTMSKNFLIFLSCDQLHFLRHLDDWFKMDVRHCPQSYRHHHLSQGQHKHLLYQLVYYFVMKIASLQHLKILKLGSFLPTETLLLVDLARSAKVKVLPGLTKDHSTPVFLTTSVTATSVLSLITSVLSKDFSAFPDFLSPECQT